MIDHEDARDVAERIAALLDAAEAGLNPMDLVLVVDELHALLVALDALPPDIVVQMERLGIG